MLTSASFFLSIYGLVTSWTYLRFFKPVFPDLDSTSQPASLRGDASETFAFAEFFPAPLRPFVAGISDQVFNVLVAMRICTPFSAADVSAAGRGGEAAHFGGAHGHGHRGGAPGSARAEAERRRALALKALDQRLHAATASAASRAGGAAAAPVVVPSTTGPTVQSQPSAGGQKGMSTTEGGAAGSGMLGETHYNPDGEGEGGRS